MTRIFISYRRVDDNDENSKVITRVYDRLQKRYGRGNVFFDQQAVPKGGRFVQVIFDAIDRSQIMLVFIGERWLSLQDEAGNTRIKDPADLVYQEVKRGLERSRLVVIPILLDETLIPRREQLPDDLVALIYRDAIRFSTPAAGFEHNIRKITDAIDSAYPPRRMPVILTGIVMLILLVGSATLIYINEQNRGAAAIDTPTTEAVAATTAVPTATATLINSETPMPTSTATPTPTVTATDTSTPTATRTRQPFVPNPVVPTPIPPTREPTDEPPPTLKPPPTADPDDPVPTSGGQAASKR